MEPLVLLVCAGLAFAVVFGAVLAFVVRPAGQKASAAEFEQRCAAVGFELLRSPSPIHVACGGEVGGRRLVLMLVETRPTGIPLPPRIDVIGEAGFANPAIPSGGVLIRPGAEPAISGQAAAQAAVRAALTPALREAVETRLGGKFAFSSYDSYVPTATIRGLVKSRWPDDWRGLMVQTWVPLDADTATIQTAIGGLLEVRDVLAASPGMTAVR